ncbi:MAG: HEAT repeat domain-containing protein [Ardenticatenales bacterium]|nr:HEAT repeat domain-containing protein [Ardenticatenales bacterium]
MEWVSNLPPDLHKFVFGMEGDETGGLVGRFVADLLKAAGRQVRGQFQMPEQQAALQHAFGAALAAALDQWVLSQEESGHDLGLFEEWLRSYDVVGQFRLLLAPGAGSALDIDLLREEFAAAGLSAEQLGKASFDALVQEMIAAFYAVASEEKALPMPMKLALRQMAEQMGALERQELVEARHAPVRDQLGIPHDLLERLRETRAKSDAFNIEGELRDLFVDHRIRPWRDSLPSYVAKTARINGVIKYLHEQENVGGENALVLFLRALSAAGPAGTSLPQKFSALADELAEGLPSGSTSSVAGSEMVLALRAWGEELVAELRTQRDGERHLTADELRALEEHYRETIIEQFKQLTFRGIASTGKPISLSLKDVFVELKAVADVPDAADSYSAEERRLLLEAKTLSEEAREEMALHLDSLRAERWNRDARRDVARLQRRSIQQTLDDASQQGIVILGDPGSGKTTLLHYLALRAAHRDGQRADVLPIFVPLAAYDDYLRRAPEKHALGDFLALYYQEWHSLPGLAPLFQQALTEGRALLLLDGLDEVLDTTTRQFVAEQAAALLRQWMGPGNRFALTSRIVGYREARVPGDLPHVTVLDFGYAEIELFAHQWCRAYEIWSEEGESAFALQQAAVEEKALLEDVRSNSSVERLAASPLLLTMLALLRRNGGKLPDRCVELYERYTRTLINNWEGSRSGGARTTTPERFEPHDAIAHLIELAFWLQQNKPSGTARRNELARVLGEICLRYEGHTPDNASPKARAKAERDAEHFLRDMRHFAGLVVERGRDAFGFLHLTFQEYFAGRALARLEPDARWSCLQPNLHRSRWREPILLCAGQLGIIEQRRDQASDFARRILYAGSEREEILHRDLFLAAALAADNVGLSSAVLNDIAEHLIALQHSSIPTVRDNALTGLAQLARQGHPAALSALMHSLQDEELQFHVLPALKPILGEAGCAPLRQAVEARLADTAWTVRAAVVGALAPLVGSDVTARQAVEVRLTDAEWYVRAAAVGALAPLVGSDVTARQAVEARLVDESGNVRAAAVRALAPLVVSDAIARQAVEARLADADWYVRAAAVGAVAPLVGSDAGIRQTVEARLLDESGNVRAAAVGALAPLVGSDATARQAVEVRLADADNDVRAAAVGALAPLVGSDATARQAVEVRLADESGNVRTAAVRSLLPLLTRDEELRPRLLSWLGTLIEEGRGQTYSDTGEDTRRAVADAYAPLLAEDEALLAQVVAMLDSVAWPARQGAAWAIIAMPGGPPPHLLPKLCALLDDMRGEESWPERLQVAELFINDQDRDLSQRAIATALAALDYATQPWYDLPKEGSKVRQQAARILGQLEPLYRDEAIFARLARVLHEDQSEEVRDAAYGALLRLAAAPERTES